MNPLIHAFWATIVNTQRFLSTQFYPVYVWDWYFKG